MSVSIDQFWTDQFWTDQFCTNEERENKRKAFAIVRGHFECHGEFGTPCCSSWNEYNVEKDRYRQQMHLKALHRVICGENSIYTNRIKVSNQCLLEDASPVQEYRARKEQQKAINYLVAYGLWDSEMGARYLALFTIVCEFVYCCVRAYLNDTEAVWVSVTLVVVTFFLVIVVSIANCNIHSQKQYFYQKRYPVYFANVAQSWVDIRSTYVIECLFAIWITVDIASPFPVSRYILFTTLLLWLLWDAGTNYFRVHELKEEFYGSIAVLLLHVPAFKKVRPTCVLSSRKALYLCLRISYSFIAYLAWLGKLRPMPRAI